MSSRHRDTEEVGAVAGHGGTEERLRMLLAAPGAPVKAESTPGTPGDRRRGPRGTVRDGRSGACLPFPRAATPWDVTPTHTLFFLCFSQRG